MLPCYGNLCIWEQGRGLVFFFSKVWAKGDVDMRLWKDYWPNRASLHRFKLQFRWEFANQPANIPNWAWGHAVSLGLVQDHCVPESVPHGYGWHRSVEAWQEAKATGSSTAFAAEVAEGCRTEVLCNKQNLLMRRWHEASDKAVPGTYQVYSPGQHWAPKVATPDPLPNAAAQNPQAASPGQCWTRKVATPDPRPNAAAQNPQAASPDSPKLDPAAPEPKVGGSELPERTAAGLKLQAPPRGRVPDGSFKGAGDTGRLLDQRRFEMQQAAPGGPKAFEMQQAAVAEQQAAQMAEYEANGIPYTIYHHPKDGESYALAHRSFTDPSLSFGEVPAHLGAPIVLEASSAPEVPEASSAPEVPATSSAPEVPEASLALKVPEVKPCEYKDVRLKDNPEVSTAASSSSGLNREATASAFLRPEAEGATATSSSSGLNREATASTFPGPEAEIFHDAEDDADLELARAHPAQKPQDNQAKAPPEAKAKVNKMKPPWQNS